MSETALWHVHLLTRVFPAVGILAPASDGTIVGTSPASTIGMRFGLPWRVGGRVQEAPADTGVRWAKALRRVAESGAPTTVEYTGETAAGKRTFLAQVGTLKATTFLALIEDRTEDKRKETVHRYRITELERLLEHTYSFVISCDVDGTDKGSVVFVFQRCSSLLYRRHRFRPL